MDIEINLNKVEIKVKRAKVGDILGFAEVRFKGGDGKALIARGYTIRQGAWGLRVRAPAHPNRSAKAGMMTSLVADPKEFWKELEVAILKAYEASPELKDNEDVNPDEIPADVGKRNDSY